MGRRTNTILQSAFFALNPQILPIDKAVEYMKEMAKKSYSKKGDEIGEGDLLAEINLEEFKRLRIDAEVYVFILNGLEIDKDYRNDKSYVYDGDCILEMKE